jgi:magnesium transporter
MQAHIVIDGEVRSTRSADEILQAQRDRRVMWIDLEERTADADRVLEAFGIHPIAAEDIWIDRVVPKVEEFAHYLHILVHGVSRGPRATTVDTWSLNIVLGATCVITNQASTRIRLPLEVCFAHLAKGVARLAHALLDHVIDGHVALIEDLGRKVDALGERVLTLEGGPQIRSAATQLYDLRRSMQRLERVSLRQLDALSGLYQGRFAMIPDAARPYFRDIYDHFVRVTDLIASYHEEIDNVLEALISVQSARTNAIMKTLTLLSTVTLPLGLIAAIFGMNYRLPGGGSPYAFPAALGIMVVVASGFVLWFRRRHWV